MLKNIVRGAYRFVGTMGLAALLTACPTNGSSIPGVDLVRPANNAIVDTLNVGLEYRVSNFDADSCNTVLNGSVVANDNDVSDGSSRLNIVSASSGLNSWSVSCDYDGSNISGNSRNFTVNAICDTNPAVELALANNLPRSIVDSVSVLGDDCVVDANESKLISNLLPGILSRSNEQIALSYPERFVGDDGKFEKSENITMSRFLLGRYDREGLLVHPGYFELVDQGHVQIPNAYFMSIFEMPFRFDIFPPANNNGKGLPIVADKPYFAGMLELDRDFPNEVAWQQLSQEYINPEIVGCSADFNYASVQLIFNNLSHSFSIDKLEVVNPLPVPARVTEVSFFVNAPDVRNARVFIEPVHWPSSFGHPGLNVTMSHMDDEDIERSGLSVGDIIPVEGRIGRVDPDFERWRLIFSYRSEEGYLRDGYESMNPRLRALDLFDPSPHNPEKRALVWPVYYESTGSSGIPVLANFGYQNSHCVFLVDGQSLFGNHSRVSPMKYIFPVDTKIK